MVKLLNNMKSQSVDVVEAINFIFDNLFGEGYGGIEATEIPNYRPYVARLKSRILDSANRGCKLGNLRISRPIKDLWERCRQDELFGDLDI